MKKKNKEGESTIRDLKAAMGRYEKSMKIHTREYARIQNALDVALKRLCLYRNEKVRDLAILKIVNEYPQRRSKYD